MSRSSALKAVIDTNVFVSGMINPRSRLGRLLIMWRDRAFELLLTDQQYDEIKDVFSRSNITWKYQITPQRLAAFYADLAYATRVVPSSSIPLQVRDVNDEPILAAAVGGNADYLVTGDRDLLVLQDNPRLGSLRIVTVSQFLALLEE